MWRLMENIIGSDDVDNLQRFLASSDKFTNGPKVAEFEEVWSNWLGVNNSTMLNSGASANYLSIALIKHLAGVGEIILPSLGWSSDASSIIQLGMKPVFVDIDPETLGMNFSSLRKAVTKKTKAIVIIHVLGFNALTPEIMKFIKDKGLFIVEDCCESHGATYETLGERKKVGTFGDVSLFSFYFGHHMSTIEGGMICCRDESVHQLARMFRSHGMTREASDEIKTMYSAEFSDLNPMFTFAVPGFNFRSTELNAVLGLSQIKKIDKNIEIRRSNLEVWLNNLDEKKFRVSYSSDGNSNFALPLILKNKDRVLFEDVKKTLQSLSVEFRIGTAGGGNLTRQPFVLASDHRVIDNQKNVDHIHEFGLYIGNGAHVTENNLMKVITQLNKLSEKND